MLSSTEIKKIFSQKEIDHNWSFAGLKRTETGKTTHSYHRYPAKFIPQIVEKLIENYIEKETAHINDPFMGSGTTIVEAIAKGFRASGTDVNGIAYLMTKVKATPIDPNYLKNQIEKFLQNLFFLSDEMPLYKNTITGKPLIPDNHIDRIKYWFPEENMSELGMILREIYEVEDENIRNFFVIAFSQILKNCSIWLQRSTKPTRDFKKKPSKPLTVLKRHLRKMERGNRVFYDIVPDYVKKNISLFLNIKKNDARNQPVQDESVDLIISSSPYVTSYEYSDLHQLSTIWLDFADDLKDYRKTFIGTSSKSAKNLELKSNLAKEIITQMKKKSKKMANEITAFFQDMQDVFDESFRILKSGGRCCFVIGNTKLKKVEILNAEVFAESIQYSGFKLDNIIKREIPSKILPQKRDERTGRFTNNKKNNTQAYPIEYIVIGKKE